MGLEFLFRQDRAEAFGAFLHPCLERDGKLIPAPCPCHVPCQHHQGCSSCAWERGGAEWGWRGHIFPGLTPNHAALGPCQPPGWGIPRAGTSPKHPWRAAGKELQELGSHITLSWQSRHFPPLPAEGIPSLQLPEPKPRRVLHPNPSRMT